MDSQEPSQSPFDTVLRALSQHVDSGGIRIGSAVEYQVVLRNLRLNFDSDFPEKGATITRKFDSWADWKLFDEVAQGLIVEALRVTETPSDEAITALWDWEGEPHLVIRAELLPKVVATVLDVPTHTYFLPPDGRWCVAFKYGGTTAFGFGKCSVESKRIVNMHLK